MEMNHKAEIEARLMMVTARAHRPLTSDETAVVRKRIERDLEQREEMQTLQLANGDAPDSGFNPRFAQDGGMVW